jgi:hypothetical protein
MTEIPHLLKQALDVETASLEPSSDFVGQVRSRGRRRARRRAAAGAGLTVVVVSAVGFTGVEIAASHSHRATFAALAASSGPSPFAAAQVQHFPPPPAALSPTCTPGAVIDKQSPASRLDTMCLPTELPRWSVRRSPDSVGSGSAGFLLSDGPEGAVGSQVTMQAFAGDGVVLAHTNDFEPRADGTVGDDVDTLHFAGHAEVLGVQGTEVTAKDGAIGILVHVDGLAIEAYAQSNEGVAPATFDQLIATLNELRWDRLNDGLPPSP